MPICAIATRGGKVVTGSWDESLRVWDIESGQCLHCHAGYPKGARHAIAICGDKIVTGCSDCTVKVLDIESGHCLKILSGHTGEVCVVMPINNNIIITGSNDRTARIWDIETGKCLQLFAGHDDVICSVAVSGDKVITGSGRSEGAAKIWNINSGKCLFTLSHRWSIDSIEIYGDKVITSSSGRVTIWDINTGQNLYRLGAPNSRFGEIARLGNKIVAGATYVGDGTIKIWDININQCLYTLSRHTGPIRAIVIADNKIITGSTDGAKIWTDMRPAAARQAMTALGLAQGRCGQHSPARSLNALLLREIGGFVIPEPWPALPFLVEIHAPARSTSWDFGCAIC